MSKEEYIKYITRMLEALDCERLQRIYATIHSMFIRIPRKEKLSRE